MYIWHSQVVANEVDYWLSHRCFFFRLVVRVIRSTPFLCRKWLMWLGMQMCGTRSSADRSSDPFHTHHGPTAQRTTFELVYLCAFADNRNDYTVRRVVCVLLFCAVHQGRTNRTSTHKSPACVICWCIIHENMIALCCAVLCCACLECDYMRTFDRKYTLEQSHRATCVPWSTMKCVHWHRRLSAMKVPHSARARELFCGANR